MNEVTEKEKKPRRARSRIELAPAYVSKIGSDCGDMADIVSKCASAVLSVDALAARELARVAEKLAQMRVLFI